MFRFTIRELVLLTLVVASGPATINGMLGFLKVRQAATLAMGLAFFLHTASTALGVVTILLEAPHDDSSVRDVANQRNEADELAVCLGLVEPLAVADRSKPLKAMFPYSYEGQSREQIERRLGKPVEWKVEDYARPVAGNLRLIPSRIMREDIDDLKEQSRFYTLGGIGGVWIFYSKDGVAIIPAAVYLRTDADFVPLGRVGDIPKRLAWERPKLEQMRLWLGVPETVAKNSKGEWAIRPKPDE